jgi:hypothetical protein
VDPTYWLPDVLVALSDVRATGCLRVDAEQGNALVFMRDGQVYAATVPTEREPLGARMVAAGLIAPEDLAAALDAQQEELLSSWRLGELVVYLGMADRLGVERLVAALLLEDLDALLSWTVTGVRFRPGVLTRQDVTPAVTVPALLDPTWRTLPDPPVFMPVPFTVDGSPGASAEAQRSQGGTAVLVTEAESDEDGEVWASPLPEVVDTADVLRQLRGLNADEDTDADADADGDAPEGLQHAARAAAAAEADAESAKPRRRFFRRGR